jgi:hypothetical protein
MKRYLRFALIASLLMASAAYGAPPTGITLIGKGLVSGSSLDKSGLTGKICQASNLANCVPAAIFGGFGSDLTYTGHDNVYVAAPDRGPFDGLTDVPYLDRLNFLHITVDVNAPFPNIKTTLLDTRLLKNEGGKSFVGAAGAFDANSEFNTLRLDPEGIRVGYNGTLYISDEYGPYVFEFDRQGHLIRRFDVPAKFRIAMPSGDPNEELLGNKSGRQANRGMEGLAISPDGKTLFGMMQNALLQDNALSPGTTDRVSVFTRILKVDLVTGQTKEFIYVLDNFNRGQGVSEILAINDQEFLVVERDNRSYLSPTPQAPTRKTIYKINVNGATDVSAIEGISASVLPAGVVPVDKKLFINLLEPTFGLDQDNSNAIPEKIEGLAWGPDLPDGRHVLYVMSDNDLDPNRATQIYAFAIDGAALNLNYQEQFIPGPLYPPGQVKKALGKNNE